jgi:hypothetical protein
MKASRFVFIFYQLEVISVTNIGNCNAHKTLFTLQENDLEFLSNDLGERLVKVVRHQKLGIYEDKVPNRQEMEPHIQLLYSLHIHRNYSKISE